MIEIKKTEDEIFWDKFIESKDDFPFFQSFDWGKIEEKTGNKIFKFRVEKNKNLVAVFQIIKINAKRGKYLYLRQGPVFKEFDEEVFKTIINFYKELGKKETVDFLRIGRFPLNFKVIEILEQYGFINSAYQNAEAQVIWVLDLNISEEELLKNMRKSHRYLIKKSKTMDIKLIKTKNIKDLERFLLLYKNLSTRKHFIAHKGIREEFEIYSKKNKEVLFLAEYKNKIIGGAIIAFVGNCAIYRHSASDDNFKQVPASYLIQWEAILEAKKRGKKIYNFWGISPDNVGKNHPWNGLTLFKTGFGGRKLYYLPIMDLPISIFYIKNYLIDFITARKLRL